ncbi:MAG TPA: hypothetical protein VFP68_19680 [Burkholderiaceae bacterium]|nr:hypothetical protein [Burkholderiaceae bacterium]
MVKFVLAWLSAVVILASCDQQPSAVGAAADPGHLDIASDVTGP